MMVSWSLVWQQLVCLPYNRYKLMPNCLYNGMVLILKYEKGRGSTQLNQPRQITAYIYSNSIYNNEPAAANIQKIQGTRDICTQQNCAAILSMNKLPHHTGHFGEYNVTTMSTKVPTAKNKWDSEPRWDAPDLLPNRFLYLWTSL